MEEYFDILNEDGEKTGEVKSRKEVHTKGYWHKAVYICIVNSKGEILMQRRSSNKAIHPNKLDISVGGHPTRGEDGLEAIIREAGEEIGVIIEPTRLEYLCTLKSAYNNGEFIDNQFLEVYLTQMDLDISKLKLQKEEVSEVKNVYYKDFEKMVNEESSEIVPFYKRLERTM